MPVWQQSLRLTWPTLSRVANGPERSAALGPCLRSALIVPSRARMTLGRTGASTRLMLQQVGGVHSGRWAQAKACRFVALECRDGHRHLLSQVVQICRVAQVGS